MNEVNEETGEIEASELDSVETDLDTLGEKINKSLDYAAMNHDVIQILIKLAKPTRTAEEAFPEANKEYREAKLALESISAEKRVAIRKDIAENGSKYTEGDKDAEIIMNTKEERSRVTNALVALDKVNSEKTKVDSLVKITHKVADLLNSLLIKKDR